MKFHFSQIFCVEGYMNIVCFEILLSDDENLDSIISSYLINVVDQIVKVVISSPLMQIENFIR